VLAANVRAETSCALGLFLLNASCVACALRVDPTRPPDLENPGTWVWRVGSLDCAWHCGRDRLGNALFPFADSGQAHQRCVTWDANQTHFAGEAGVVQGSLKTTTFVHITHKKEEISHVEVIIFGGVVFATILVLLFK